jgi:hypothetical protein
MSQNKFKTFIKPNKLLFSCRINLTTIQFSVGKPTEDVLCPGDATVRNFHILIDSKCTSETSCRAATPHYTSLTRPSCIIACLGWVAIGCLESLDVGNRKGIRRRIGRRAERMWEKAWICRYTHTHTHTKQEGCKIQKPQNFGTKIHRKGYNFKRLWKNMQNRLKKFFFTVLSVNFDDWRVHKIIFCTTRNLFIVCTGNLSF